MDLKLNSNSDVRTPFCPAGMKAHEFQDFASIKSYCALKFDWHHYCHYFRGLDSEALIFGHAKTATPNTPLCCESVVSSASAAASAVGAVLGLDLTGLNVDVGLSCSPITVIGNNCTAATCDALEEQWGGLTAINCIPITA
ncbi:hypothetical protein C8J57DRAFT_1514647 [Mycena rebaudengoi]|nr:hypothetical protein C8J57DRAFT_1514647 [Mycena rebaudengoi]